MNTPPLTATLAASPKSLIDYWETCATIQPNNFRYKSLSCWSYNTAIGCLHGCLFCYVPAASVNKQARLLSDLGVDDPDAQWGEYVFLRPWDEKKFLSSLSKAENTPLADLNTDGNRAIMFCSTTDPYQVLSNPAPGKTKELNLAATLLVQNALERIRDLSTLRVRILTRSPLARRDFKLYKTFGPRLLFGMSLPTLRDDLSRIYEPHAPSPRQRLATLRAAKDAGIPIYVAMAPTYPECDARDLANTLEAIAQLDPVTVFAEPINIRAENVARIEAHAATLGVNLKTRVFATPEAWQDYAISALKDVERLAAVYGLQDRLHLWPDKSLGTQAALMNVADPSGHLNWLHKYWHRISEWPAA